jgi:hypothetical protein
VLEVAPLAALFLLPALCTLSSLRIQASRCPAGPLLK